uniref:Pectinesterase inhibitor domain-containing protein n=3 Tax=Triticinae TaxID=1648030 RepID=A0A453MCF9_AEGTS
RVDHDNMASASTRHLLLVAVVLAVSHSARANPVTVGQACKLYAKHASSCTEALAKAPGMPVAPMPLPVLAELAVTYAAASGSAALAFIKRMEMLAGGTMPLDCVEKCVEKFQTAVAALQKNRAAIIEHRDVARVKRWVRMARADGETCMDKCHMKEGGADPTIIRKITDLGKLCSVALTLADAAATHG